MRCANNWLLSYALARAGDPQRCVPGESGN